MPQGWIGSLLSVWPSQCFCRPRCCAGCRSPGHLDLLGSEVARHTGNSCRGRPSCRAARTDVFDGACFGRSADGARGRRGATGHPGGGGDPLDEFGSGICSRIGNLRVSFGHRRSMGSHCGRRWRPGAGLLAPRGNPAAIERSIGNPPHHPRNQTGGGEYARSAPRIDAGASACRRIGSLGHRAPHHGRARPTSSSNCHRRRM